MAEARFDPYRHHRHSRCHLFDHQFCAAGVAHHQDGGYECDLRAHDVLTVTGFSLWLGYGVLQREWPLIVPNAICLGLAAFILLMKLLPRTRREAIAARLDPSTENS